MTTSLYDLSVLTFLQTMRAVSGILDRAAKHCIETGAEPVMALHAAVFAVTVTDPLVLVRLRRRKTVSKTDAPGSVKNFTRYVSSLSGLSGVVNSLSEPSGV